MAGEGHAHRALEKGCVHLLLEGLVEVFGETISVKNQSFLWTEDHLDVVEVGT